MDPNKWTERTSKAFLAARSLAVENSHIQIMPLHIMVALMDDDDSLAKRLFTKAGGDATAVSRGLQKRMVRLPSQTPAPDEPGASKQLQDVLKVADKIRSAQQDTHLAVDHLLLAALDDKDVSEVLKECNIRKKQVEAAVKEVRGGRKVESKSAEDTFEALEKYGQDLTKLAEEGKLDPVIGRDNEIRRVIQVLSRRTKNNPILIGEPGVGKVRLPVAVFSSFP